MSGEVCKTNNPKYCLPSTHQPLYKGLFCDNDPRFDRQKCHKWANTFANKIVVTKDSYSDKKAEEQMSQEQFTDFEEKWIVFECKGA